jgi:hypothetical protein
MARTSVAVMAAAAAAVSRAMQATIESLGAETPTVKMLRLKLVCVRLSFQQQQLYPQASKQHGCCAHVPSGDQTGSLYRHMPCNLALVVYRSSSCLQETPSNFGFAPGQWVDFHVPGLQAVGGYSICSTPGQLQQTGTLDLCVKRSGHPCAQWVHGDAEPGKQVCDKAATGTTGKALPLWQRTQASKVEVQ